MTDARFVTSAAKPAQFPPADRPEVAFAGRSNVGKSSMLNKLMNRRNLARTSSTPGRTQLINFFSVGDLQFVDLPGFGYAKVPMEVRAKWQPMVEGYLTAPRDIRGVVLLLDIRRDPGTEEVNLIAWLVQRGIAVLPVATKADKVSRGRRAQRLAAIARALVIEDHPIAFSALSGEGREVIWEHIRLLTRPLEAPPEETVDDTPV